MADMNGRMNGSQCVPPRTLCIQIPSLQASTEDLPLMLQRPDNFPLVMGILQEINQEKVGFTGCAGIEQRTLSVSEVKQESADVEEQHQSLNSDLCQEWSLKGVEELLTEPEDLQLRHDCSQLAHEPGVEHLGVCAVDEKPSVTLQSVHPQHNWNGSEQTQLQVDEKPIIQLQITSSLEEQVLIQENALLHVNEKPKVKEVFFAASSQGDVDSESHLAVPVSTQVHSDDKLGLHSMKAVKREPEEVDAQAPTYDKQAKSLEAQKGSNDCLDVCQSVDNNASFRLNQCKKSSLSGYKSHAKRSQSSEQEREKRRLFMQNGQRNSNAVLALPADFSELEPSHSGKGNSQSSPSTSPSLRAEGSMQHLVIFKKDPVLAGDQSVAEPDCCELTLGSAALKSQVANLGCPSLANCVEVKTVIESFNGPKKHDDGQCQRTSPLQWQQAKKRSVLRESHRYARRDTMPARTKKQLFPATDGSCGKNGENPLEQSGNFSLNMKKSGAQPQTVRATRNSKTESITRLDKKGSGQSLERMPQMNVQGASREKGGTQKLVSDDGQMSEEPNSPEAMESSQAPEPQKKKMRGTLPLDEKNDVFFKDKDTRCHRSDGKSWRCVRECINGAYYCQYHLRKRRIGYNRRKNNEVNPNDLEAVSQEALKSNKKSR